jgi:hypothetical protein
MTIRWSRIQFWLTRAILEVESMLPIRVAAQDHGKTRVKQIPIVPLFRRKTIVLNGAPGQIRTGDPLLRSRSSIFIKTCRSERKAAGNQQVVTTSDQPLAPFSSPLSRLFAAICHN